MPILQCRKCQLDVLVLGFAPTGPKRCPGCGARWVSADPRPDLTRLSTGAIEAKRSMASSPRFRRSGPRVTG